MRIICLGGAGNIGREIIFDLVQFSDFEKITIGDINEEESLKVLEWLDDGRVDFKRININNTQDAIAQIKDYDIIIDCTSVRMNKLSGLCIAEAGCNGINLTGGGDVHLLDDVFKKNNKTFVSGFGMSPGISQLMVKHASNQLDSIDSIRISHGAFRPFAFSRSIVESTMHEFDPANKSRVYFENGNFIEVPPFSRALEVELPSPYGKTVQYIIPRPEVKTLASYLKDKDIKLIEVRGAWPEKNMNFLRMLYDWGFLRNDKIEMIENTKIGILDCIAEYLNNSKEGTENGVFGYALHVEVIGFKGKKKYRYTLTHTHPASDGTIRNWVKQRAYTRNIAIPVSIASQILSKGLGKSGVISAEEAFDPEEVFKELERRHILIHKIVNIFD